MARITTKQLEEMVADYATTFEGWRSFKERHLYANTVLSSKWSGSPSTGQYRAICVISASMLEVGTNACAVAGCAPPAEAQAASRPEG